MQYTADRIASERWNLNHFLLYSFFENITMRGDMIYNNLPSAKLLRSVFEYNEETGKLFWKKKVANCVHVGTEAGYKSGPVGRLQVTFQGTVYYVSRIIWKIMTGSMPKDKQIDHDDRNHCNNVWDNLRLKTQSENMRNQSLPCNNSSGIIGVSFHNFSGLWMGKISRNKKQETKYFKTMDEAIYWRKEKEVLYGYHKNHGKNLTF